MLTIIVYVAVTLVVAAGLFGLSLVVFGRSEVLPPVARDHTVTHLPDEPLTGDDLRSVRFGMSARGYTMAEVDWALDQAAAEIDRLRARLGEGPAGPPGPTDHTDPAGDSGDSGAEDVPGAGDVGAGGTRTRVDGRPATASGRDRTR